MRDLNAVIDMNAALHICALSPYSRFASLKLCILDSLSHPAPVSYMLSGKHRVFEMSKRWLWCRNGALIGLTLVLSDYLFEWRGPRFLPWQGRDAIAQNVIQMLNVVCVCALIGFAAGLYAGKPTRMT